MTMSPPVKLHKSNRTSSIYG